MRGRPNARTQIRHLSSHARSIAENLLERGTRDNLILRLGGLDADATEACALAHDLGHPPFGHIGEEVFDRVCRETFGLVDGFEGNAQTFRIITKLETRAIAYPGLDLTRATRAGVLKYPWRRRIPLTGDLHAKTAESDREYRLRTKKFGHYAPEQSEFEDARSFLGGTQVGDDSQSLEASVMDVADDITYAIHDLEDFYQARFIDVPRMWEEFRLHKNGQSEILGGLADRLSKDYLEYFDKFTYGKIVGLVGDSLHQVLGSNGFDGSREQIAVVKRWAAEQIGHYVGSVDLVAKPIWPGGGNAVLGKNEWHEVQVLKELTRAFVVQRAELAAVQRAQQSLLESLVVLMTDWRRQEKVSSRLPQALREYGKMVESNESERGVHGDRAVIDYLCRMTDDQCTSLYQTLAGISFQGVADRFLL